jgi:hypothetical protein
LTLDTRASARLERRNERVKERLAKRHFAMHFTGVQFTVRWFMVRVAVMAFPFIILPHLKSWGDWGAVVVLLAAYAGIEVAIRPGLGGSEQKYDL